MAHHAAREFQRLVALIGLGRFERAPKKFAHHLGCGRFLKFGDEAASQLKSDFPFILVADLGGWAGEVEAPGR